MSEIASALPIGMEEATLVAELKAGSEQAYAWLVAHYHQPVYSLVYRMLHDPADAADTTQEVFLKVFRGMRRFNGRASLKTWIYRIALHEAANRRRWWFRHKSQETSIEPAGEPAVEPAPEIRRALVDGAASPFENALHDELRERVERELSQVPEPYRSTVILRDIEELSYEEIAEVTETSLGTVKSRLTRGREHLRRRLERSLRPAGVEPGNEPSATREPADGELPCAASGPQAEVVG